MTGPSIVASADGTAIAGHTVGRGEPAIVVGGALRAAEDYLPLARAMSSRFEVHVIDRRGRGASGAQGSDYNVERECEDLEAVRRATGATRVFGHSYGGLIALEAAKNAPALTHVAVYEPAVSVDGSIPTSWIEPYRRALADGDRRAAFALFVRGSGHAPGVLTRMPLRYIKLILRVAIAKRQWSRMEPLLEANAAEHAEVQRLDGTSASYERIMAGVLLLAGAESPRSSRRGIEALERVLPQATSEILDGLAHNAPDENAPPRVAEHVERFFSGSPARRAGKPALR
jgi:pimeloyl-ACP methyl ester carboxylesterase